MSMTTFKTRIYLTEEQESLVKQMFGLRRLFFNYALDQIYLKSSKPNTTDLLNNLYRGLDNQTVECSILLTEAKYGRCQHLYKEAFEDAVEAIKAAEKKNKRKAKGKKKQSTRVDYARKKDRKDSASFYGKSNTTISVEGPYQISIGFNKMVGRIYVRTRESVAFLKTRTDKIRTATIKYEAGKYYISLTYERTNRVLEKAPANTEVGIDLGVKIAATTYDGKTIAQINFNTKGSVRSERLANKVDLSRKREGSKRYEKAVLLKEKRSQRSARQRLAQVDNFISYLVTHFAEIKIDDFSFGGALKVAAGKDLYRSMKGTFLTRLENKAKEYGTKITYIPHQKGVKTTHICSSCGSTDVDIDRKTRVLTCKECGLTIDRDANGAINTYNYH